MTLHDIFAEENLTSSNLYRIFLNPFAIIPDGLGFGITHSMVTTMFEMNLQLVKPKIALPYWDFTIEGAVVDAQLDGDFTRLTEASDLWNEDWFGSVNQEDWQVKNGRSAYLEVPIIDQEHRDFMGADVFGRMRSPWNVNDRPYLVRGLGEMCGIHSTSLCECFVCFRPRRFSLLASWCSLEPLGNRIPTESWASGPSAQNVYYAECRWVSQRWMHCITIRIICYYSSIRTQRSYPPPPLEGPALTVDKRRGEDSFPLVLIK